MYNPPNQEAAQLFPFQNQSGPPAPSNRQKKLSPSAAHSNSRSTPSTASNPNSFNPNPYIPPMPNHHLNNSQNTFYIPPQQNSAEKGYNNSLLNSTTNPSHGFQPGATQVKSVVSQVQPQPIYQTNPFQPTTATANNTSFNQNPYQPNKPSTGVDQYFNEFQSSATGQIGMQLGTQAISTAKQHISSNVGRYFDLLQWRYYFNVSNSYVLTKIQLLVFPFLHKGWARIVEQIDENSQVGAFAPPRSDLNAPDLYIPVMSFITYVIITGIVAGLDSAAATTVAGKTGKVGKGFTPDVLGLTASTASFLTIFDVFFVKMGNYFLNVTADSPLLELIAYSGYKFIPISFVLLIKHFAGSWAKIIAFSYLFFAYGFFKIRCLRSLIIPENSGGTMNDLLGSARKQRIVYLFIIVFIECVISWILI